MIVRSLEAYMGESWDGDLLELMAGNLYSVGMSHLMHLDNKSLDAVKFFEKVTSCDKECGECDYCAAIAGTIDSGAESSLPQKSPTWGCSNAFHQLREWKHGPMTRDNWVRSLGLDADGSLFVEIDNGIRLFDSCLQPLLHGAVTIPPQDLMRPENRQLYYRFLTTLKEIETIFINSIYDGSHPFKRGSVVVDAGARIGTFAAKISGALGEEGRIIALEPEPRNFACLRKNIEANGLRNVVAIQKALWSRTQRLDMYLSGNAAAHSAYQDAFYSSTNNSISVEADTLDSILQELGIASVDFVKMDIEGSEIEALKGMRKTLGSQVQLAIAAYHPVEGQLAHTVIAPQLTQLGFKATYADGIVHARRQTA